MFIICGIELIAQLIRSFPEASVKLIQKGLLLAQIRRYNSTWLDLTWLDLTWLDLTWLDSNKLIFCSCRLVIIGVDYSNLWVVLKCCFWCGFRSKDRLHFFARAKKRSKKSTPLTTCCSSFRGVADGEFLNSPHFKRHCVAKWGLKQKKFS